MIALKFGLPLIRCDTGRSVAFDTVWLRMALTKAAIKAGYQSWWLADDLVEGIASFLRHDYPSGVIDLVNLERTVRTVLCEVGYEEVAARFYTPPPSHRISLVQCLREVSQNNRSEFFADLARQITRLHQTRSSHVHFSDLHACVRGLSRIHPSTRACDDQRLLQHIVAFVQERVQSLCWQDELVCSIS